MPLLQIFTSHRSAAPHIYPKAYHSRLQGSTVSEAESTFCMPFTRTHKTQLFGLQRTWICRSLLHRKLTHRSKAINNEPNTGASSKDNKGILDEDLAWCLNLRT